MKTEKLIAARVDLDRRIKEIQTLGKSRESALALTLAQQGRMLLGKTAELLGSATPYPQSDNPASAVVAPPADVAADFEPELVEDPIAAVKTVRAGLQTVIDDLTLFRRHQWPRAYGGLDEAVFDRALTELMLAKNWLGMELSRLAAKAPKKSKAEPEKKDEKKEDPAQPPATAETAPATAEATATA